VTKHLETDQIRELADIQEQLSREFKLARNIQTIEEEEALSARIEELKSALDDIVAHECVLCGDIMINSVKAPFIGKDEAELAASWTI
jgi:hypothetical protein